MENISAVFIINNRTELSLPLEPIRGGLFRAYQDCDLSGPMQKELGKKASIEVGSPG
jgi:hypothetical protein